MNQTTTVNELIEYLHQIAPNQYQESYDNSGLLVGDGNEPIEGVLISLDCTEEIVDEAIAKGCNVIVAHHPIVFKGLKRFNGKNYVERTIIKAIKHDIVLFAIHTNLDNVRLQGVNSKIAELIGISNTEILAPKDETNEIGSGMIGDFMPSLPLSEFLSHLKDKMQLKYLKHTADLGQNISKVAICGGSGSFLLETAKKRKADILITSDFKYHEFFDADGKIVIADIGHYESERFTIDLLYDLISNKFSNFAAHCTALSTNPVNYF